MDWSKVHGKLAGRFRLLERRNDDGDCVTTVSALWAKRE